MTAGGQTALSSLLSIDVEAEVSRLTTGHIDGGWQVPVELVRRAVGAHARLVGVDLGRMALTVEDDGEPISRRALEQLARLVSGHEAPVVVHEAVTWLETRDPSLLMLAAPWIAEVRLESGGRCLAWRRGTRATLVEGSKGPRSGTQVHLRGPTEPARAREALESACRFAPVRVLVGGRPLPQGFGDMIATAPLRSPLTGRIALRANGDVSRAWILVHGIVATHITLPAAPPFDAVVSLGDQRASPSALRARFEPLAPDLARQAFDLACDTARSADVPSWPQQDRLARGLLTAARQQRQIGAIMSLPLVPAIRNGARVRLSLEDLARRLDRWPAILPHENPGDLLPSERPVLVLGTELRAALAGLARLQFTTPARRPRPTRMSGGPSAWGAILKRGLAALMALAPRTTVPQERLTQAERRLLRELAEALGDEAVNDVSMCEGRRAPRLSRRRLRLARRHPDVVAAARWVERDARWVYPALLALLPRHAGAATAARAAWLTLDEAPAIVSARR